MKLERCVGCERLQPAAPQYLDDLRLRARTLMGEHRLARGDDKRVGGDGLDAALEGAGLDGNLDIASMRVSSAAKSTFCSSMGSARSRLRNCGIGGRSSLRLPSQVSFSPVASSKRESDHPSMWPRQSAM